MTEEKHIYLYKYLPYNTGSLNVLTEGTLKYTCPLEFNDPFDCRPSYCADSLNDIHINKTHLIHQIGKQHGLSPAKRIQSKRKIAKTIRSLINSGETQIGLLSKVGVISLTTDPLSILMWSHYADFHKGFVVEFKIPLHGQQLTPKQTSQHLIPLKVNYDNVRPIIRYGIDSELVTLHKTIYSKSLAWEYEKEHRVIDHYRGPGVHKYERNKLLNSVICGMKMCDENHKNLSYIISKLNKNKELKHLKLYRAEAAKEEYKIIIPNYFRCQ